MPIPKFNPDGVLPPHQGDPESMAESSPYAATSLELCERFATSPERIEILRGFLGLRALLRQLHITEGFQWVDGGFLEDDRTLRRPPEQIQVVTFCQPCPLLHDPDFADLTATLVSRKKTRDQYRVDHMPVLLSLPPEKMVDHARYWCNLLSHQRETGIWKGMLRIPLNTTAEDTAALLHLNAVEEA